MGRRFAVGGLIVVLLTAVGVVGIWLKVLHDEIGSARPQAVGEGVDEVLADVPPDKAQSILVLGTDRRYGDRKSGLPVRSDTMMVVHLDPDNGGTAVMSLPRDLLVTIPGHGRGRINGAYAKGGAKLAVQTVNRLGFDVSHVIGVNFGGFRRAVNRLGCVYVDVDRRYFNDNDPPVASTENYATIDLRPGYQRVCGQDALDYVRFRHLDDDFVRAARQQEFLRQAKGQIAVTQAIRDRKALLKIFSDYSESDLSDASDAKIFGLLKLAYASSQHRVREVSFPPTERRPDESLVVSAQRLQRAIRQFKGGAGATAPATKKHQRRRSGGASGASPSSATGVVTDRVGGENHVLAIAASLGPALPVVFPKTRLGRGGYARESPRAYDIQHSGGGSHRAYRIVLSQGDSGQYYGVQGTTWRTPPILKGPHSKRRMRGRTYSVYSDGGRIRLVAWRTRRAVYWVSNTLSGRLSNAQMLAVARSLVRVGQ
jgi:polyisoprenyl-teichoic acid--peptidoglycan teichoic acid transferase